MYKIENEFIDYVVAVVNNERIMYSAYNSMTENNWLENTILDIHLSFKNDHPNVQIEKFYTGSFLQLANTTKSEIKTFSENFEWKNKL